jgi:glucose-1-phosphate thymidylyltransferase
MMVENIGFVISRSFDKACRAKLLAIAEKLGAKGICSIRMNPWALRMPSIVQRKSYQEGPLLPLQIHCLKQILSLDTKQDGIIWVHQVDDPSAFGVVKLDAKGQIDDFVEKPAQFVSDLAIIGIYYFKSGDLLKMRSKS